MAAKDWAFAAIRKIRRVQLGVTTPNVQNRTLSSPEFSFPVPHRDVTENLTVRELRGRRPLTSRKGFPYAPTRPSVGQANPMRN
jgi:hypothetical protein